MCLIIFVWCIVIDFTHMDNNYDGDDSYDNHDGNGEVDYDDKLTYRMMTMMNMTNMIYDNNNNHDDTSAVSTYVPLLYSSFLYISPRPSPS